MTDPVSPVARPGSGDVVARFWDDHAHEYDRRMTLTERWFLRRGRDFINARAAGDVLEVGVGTGATLAGYRYGAEGVTSVVAIDVSARMGEIAAARLAQLPVPARWVLVDGSEPLPTSVAQDQFDTVVASLVLCSVPDVDESLAAFAQVLRPGGQLLLLDHVASSLAPVRWGQRLLEPGVARRTGERFTRRPREHLARHGFEVVESGRAHLGIVEWVRARRG